MKRLVHNSAGHVVGASETSIVTYRYSRLLKHIPLRDTSSQMYRHRVHLLEASCTINHHKRVDHLRVHHEHLTDQLFALRAQASHYQCLVSCAITYWQSGTPTKHQPRWMSAASIFLLRHHRHSHNKVCSRERESFPHRSSYFHIHARPSIVGCMFEVAPAIRSQEEFAPLSGQERIVSESEQSNLCTASSSDESFEAVLLDLAPLLQGRPPTTNNMPRQRHQSSMIQ